MFQVLSSFPVPRFVAAIKVAFLHFLSCVFVALFAAVLVFALWYPYPYRELSGGRELFLLIIVVDVVCGPLLTLVLFNPAKQKSELWRDFALVILIQLAALVYGLNTVWKARPLFLVQEVDRFKVVNASSLNELAFASIPSDLKPGWMSGPVVVAIREPKDNKEREKVMFAAVAGGPDYAERPEFYLPYEGAAALKSTRRAKLLSLFLQRHPSQEEEALKLAAEKGSDIRQWLYLPVIAREDWVTVIDKQGKIQGFLRGDGF